MQQEMLVLEQLLSHHLFALAVIKPAPMRNRSGQFFYRTARAHGGGLARTLRRGIGDDPEQSDSSRTLARRAARLLARPNELTN